jgi:single-strand DNA-binding protein
MSFQQVIIEGRLGQDPETRSLSSGKQVTNFSVAVSEKYRDEERTEWFKCVAFEGNGKGPGVQGVADKYLRKGKRVMVVGKLQTRKWEDKEGNTRYSTDLVVQNLNLIEFPDEDEREERPARGKRDERPARRDEQRDRGARASDREEARENDDDLDDDLPF